MTTSKKNNKGFTLIEVLVSIAMLGLLLVPLLNYFSNNTKLNIKEKETQRATTIAQSVMEEFKSYDTIETIVRNYNIHTVTGSAIATKGRVANITNVNTYIEDEYDAATAPNKYYFIQKDIESDGKKFDVFVSVEPEEYKNINDIKIPVITSLNGTDNVMAKEVEETMNAVLGFQSRNIAAAGAASAVDISILKQKLQKNIIVNITKGNREGCIRVTIYNEYIISGGNSIPGCDKAIESDYLYNEEVEYSEANPALKGIYLFYNYDVFNATEIGNIMQGIEVRTESNLFTSTPKFRLYAICQRIYNVENPTDIIEPTDLTPYKIKINTNTWPNMGFFSNYPYNFNGVNVSSKGMDLKDLVGREKLQRLSKVNVQVFDAGTGFKSKRRVEINSTRGE